MKRPRVQFTLWQMTIVVAICAVLLAAVRSPIWLAGFLTPLMLIGIWRTGNAEERRRDAVVIGVVLLVIVTVGMLDILTVVQGWWNPAGLVWFDLLDVRLLVLLGLPVVLLIATSLGRFQLAARTIARPLDPTGTAARARPQSRHEVGTP